MNWVFMLWIDGIDHNNQRNRCDRIKTRNISEHKLITWYAKHVINHDVAVIDNHNNNYQTLKMECVTGNLKKYE